MFAIDSLLAIAKVRYCQPVVNSNRFISLFALPLLNMTKIVSKNIVKPGKKVFQFCGAVLIKILLIFVALYF